MAGISVKLPLNRDDDDGLGLNKTLPEVVKQNFINLLLTIKGERVMLSNFGVGLKQYLFDNDNPSLRSELMAEIRTQTLRYLPYINIQNITFLSDQDQPSLDNHFLGIHIEYMILPLRFVDKVSVVREDNNIITF